MIKEKVIKTPKLLLGLKSHILIYIPFLGLDLKDPQSSYIILSGHILVTLDFGHSEVLLYIAH